MSGDAGVTIERVLSDKWRYRELLLLADEQEDMVARYLDRGTMYLLRVDGAAAAQCVVTDEGDGLLELKSLSVLPQYQKKGCGRALIAFVEETYQGMFHTLQVGTGDSPLTLPFYEKCGFAESHRLKNFFTEHYDHPIIEAGVRLTDMVCLRKTLRAAAGK